ncbi:MAG: hypothetical protein K2X27_07715 [Candidatus Obscuribacterales bacterium]|nr:hypothetical protein [Candidatus Obscuribacterales bacterium]
MSVIARSSVAFLCLFFFQAQALQAEEASNSLSSSVSKATPLSVLAQMPVKEVTTFKDGHAFLLHEGSMPCDSHGNVVMDYLPAPVLGTFWPFSADKNARLSSVTASKHRVSVPRSALNVREFVEANPGAHIELFEIKNGASQNATTVSYEAEILGIPQRSSEELERTSPPNSGEQLPEFADCVLVKTATGVSAVPLSKIDHITFKSGYEAKLSREEFRNLLTLKLDWGKAQSRTTADVGMMYLQKGIRWIPQYKVNIDGNGSAKVKLQATLVNDLTDLKDVTVNLVVGVPSFAFKDNIDPISLQETLAAVSSRIADRRSHMNYLSNAIMSQTAQMRDESVAAGAEAPELPTGSSNEDLFVFTVKHVSLAKGQRMTLPVYETELSYKDVYTLTIPFSPPPEIVQNFNYSQQSEIERQSHAPKFMHKLRLTNKSAYPLSTAPALLLKNDKVIAQGTMTYTAVGASNDIPLTTAVDLKIKKQDKEIQRVPNAASWQGDQYGRVDLSGMISTTNYGNSPAEIEVVRYVLGKTGKADHEGKSEMVNVFEDYEFLPDGESLHPVWWGWYSWPNWWSRFNGVGKISWKQNLKPKESLDLNYNWSYYWR